MATLTLQFRNKRQSVVFLEENATKDPVGTLSAAGRVLGLWLNDLRKARKL
jgi:hypothetical protein